MNTYNILSIVVFAITMSITPGPNNIMLTASGANYGYLRTLPHILGILFGVALLNSLSALGLKQIFILMPSLKKILKFIGSGYMLFLAYKIASSKKRNKNRGSGKPFNFFQAAGFQVLNLKAVLMTITSMSVYTQEGDSYYTSALIIIVVFIVCGFPSISIWAGFGTVIGNFFKNEFLLKVFNYIMGGLTAVCAVLLLL